MAAALLLAPDKHRSANVPPVPRRALQRNAARLRSHGGGRLAVHGPGPLTSSRRGTGRSRTAVRPRWVAGRYPPCPSSLHQYPHKVSIAPSERQKTLQNRSISVQRIVSDRQTDALLTSRRLSLSVTSLLPSRSPAESTLPEPTAVAFPFTPRGSGEAQD